MIELLLIAASALTKWDTRVPKLDYISKANIYDAERCLINTDEMNLAFVYRQPDRPNNVTLTWVGSTMNTRARVDMTQKGESLHVIGWVNTSEFLEECAPRK